MRVLTKKFLHLKSISQINLAGQIRTFVDSCNARKVCIVGSGPAGFYAAQQLIKLIPNVEVDMIERLPVPFGLVRYGVAPDHPEVKNVINTFTKTARCPQLNFIGNVNLGTDITLNQLMEAYHAVLLTYGADEDRKLGIPGEDLPNVLSAREFVGWYNGLPSCQDVNANLDTDTAVILGQGNVALDVARIMLTPVDVLKKTDITESALSALSSSRIRRVIIVGRRGPLQVAFTIKEFREMLNLPQCITVMDRSIFSNIPEKIPGLERPRRRLTELLCKAALDQTLPKEKANCNFELVFLRSPLSFVADHKTGHLKGVKLAINTLSSDGCSAEPTSEAYDLECGLVLRSIGYRSICVDPQLPFDAKKGIVMNDSGIVKEGLYAAGWVASGPTGVILSTMNNAFAVAKTISNHLTSIHKEIKPGSEAVYAILKNKGIQAVNFAGWELIDKEEINRGIERGKPREKIINVEEMLSIAEAASR